MLKLDGYELIVGSSIDPQFGPVLLFGTGGTLVEVFKDRALALPPLNTTLAQRMIEQTKIYTALKGVRGREAVDMPNLLKILVRFSQLVMEQPWIKEIDINPLLASAGANCCAGCTGCTASARYTGRQIPAPGDSPLPNDSMLINGRAEAGFQLAIRPIRPEDEPMLIKFHETLSERTVYMRYLQAMNLSQRTGHERLSRISFIDYDREIALVAIRINPETNAQEIIGIGRLTKQYGTRTGRIWPDGQRSVPASGVRERTAATSAGNRTGRGRSIRFTDWCCRKTGRDSAG